MGQLHRLLVQPPDDGTHLIHKDASYSSCCLPNLALLQILGPRLACLPFDLGLDLLQTPDNPLVQFEEGIGVAHHCFDVGRREHRQKRERLEVDLQSGDQERLRRARWLGCSP